MQIEKGTIETTPFGIKEEFAETAREIDSVVSRLINKLSFDIDRKKIELVESLFLEATNEVLTDNNRPRVRVEIHLPNENEMDRRPTVEIVFIDDVPVIEFYPVSFEFPDFNEMEGYKNTVKLNYRKLIRP